MNKPVRNRTITISQGNDGKVGVSFNTPLDLSDALQLYFTGGLSLLKSYTPQPHPLANSPETLEIYEEAKGEIYDMFNVGASQVLDVYAPELALRPDLTTASIFEAELSLLSEKYGIPRDTLKEYAQKARSHIKNEVLPS